MLRIPRSTTGGVLSDSISLSRDLPRATCLATGCGHVAETLPDVSLLAGSPALRSGAAPGLVCDEEGSWQEPRGPLRVSDQDFQPASESLKEKKKSLAVSPGTDVRRGQQMAFSGCRRVFWAQICLRRTLFSRRSAMW